MLDGIGLMHVQDAAQRFLRACSAFQKRLIEKGNGVIARLQ